MPQVESPGHGSGNSPEHPAAALIALGSNQPSQVGTPVETLVAATRELARTVGNVRSVSRIYETPCWPAGAGPDYANAAVAIDWSGQPEGLLDRLHQIEEFFDRRRAGRWASRTLDLDLIGLGLQVAPDADTQRRWAGLPQEAQRRKAPGELILPHPRLQDRAFVLAPLMDIAPEWRHPVTDRSVRAMWEALSVEDRDAVIPLVNLAQRA